VKPNQPLFDGCRDYFSLVNQPEREADHLPPSSAEIKNKWNYAFNPTIRLDRVERESFKFTRPNLAT